MQTVYIETTIPSYLAAKPSSLAAVQSDQRATHDWWQNERQLYRLYTSILPSTKFPQVTRTRPGGDWIG